MFDNLQPNFLAGLVGALISIFLNKIFHGISVLWKRQQVLQSRNNLYNRLRPVLGQMGTYDALIRWTDELEGLNNITVSSWYNVFNLLKLNEIINSPTSDIYNTMKAAQLVAAEAAARAAQAAARAAAPAAAHSAHAAAQAARAAAEAAVEGVNVAAARAAEQAAAVAAAAAQRAVNAATAEQATVDAAQAAAAAESQAAVARARPPREIHTCLTLPSKIRFDPADALPPPCPCPRPRARPWPMGPPQREMYWPPMDFGEMYWPPMYFAGMYFGRHQARRKKEKKKEPVKKVKNNIPFEKERRKENEKKREKSRKRESNRDKEDQENKKNEMKKGDSKDQEGKKVKEKAKVKEEESYKQKSSSHQEIHPEGLSRRRMGGDFREHGHGNEADASAHPHFP